MPATLLLLLRALAFLSLCLALFGSMERAWPLRPQRFFRAQWMLDAAYAVWSPLWIALGLSVTLPLLRDVLPLVVPASWPAAVARLPWWGRVALVFLLMELLLYALHRLQHSVPALWRMHAVHHGTTTLDWLASQRQHPVEAIVSLTVAALPGLALDFPLAPLTGLVLLQKLHAVWVHANVDLPHGGWERWLTGPRFHHWHHDGDPRARACNFAATLAVLDRVFGTQRLPAGHPRRHGVYGAPQPTRWEQLFHVR